MNLKRVILTTPDAHSLYEEIGFEKAAHLENVMQLSTPDRTGAAPSTGGGVSSQYGIV